MSGATLLHKLQSSDIKLTRQRKLIAQKIDVFEKPFSAEDLFLKGLKREGIDLATIYRTLHLLNEKGWLTRTDLGDGHTRYLSQPQSRHVHTLICTQCHKVEFLNDCLLQKQHQELLKRGFTSVTHKVEFSGLCPDCQKNKEQTHEPSAR